MKVDLIINKYKLSMDLNLNSSKIVFLFLFQEEKREFIFHEYFQSETQKKCFNHLNVELGNFLRV